MTEWYLKSNIGKWKYNEFHYERLTQSRNSEKNSLQDQLQHHQHIMNNQDKIRGFL